MPTPDELNPAEQAAAIKFNAEMAVRKALIDAKTAAIRQQSPELSLAVVTRTATQEADANKSIEGSVKFMAGPVKLRQYEIRGESPEVMAKWKGEVTAVLDGLKDAIATGDFAKVIEVCQDKIHTDDIKKGLAKLELQSADTGIPVDEEAQKLLAIGLWIQREQGGKWKSGQVELKTAGRILSGSSQLADALSPENDPSCLEISHLVQAMSRELGIKGQIKTTPRFGVDHRYFASNSGKIMDYWWLRGTGGVALNEQAFKDAQLDAKTQSKNRLGSGRES